MGCKEPLFKIMMERVGSGKLTEEKVIMKSKFMGMIVVRISDSIFAVDKKCYEDYIKNKNGV